MLSKIAKIILTTTSIAPIGFTFSWVLFRSGKNDLALTLVGASLFLILICIYLLRFVKNKLEKINFTPISIEAADRENLEFILIYLLPLFTADIMKLNWDVWLPSLLILGVLLSTGFGYHFNPLLGVMGWHFYKVGTREGVTYVLITKKEIRSANQPFVVGQLTEYIVIEIEGEKH